MKHILRFPTLLILALLTALPAAAENDGDCVYRLYAASGEYLTARAGRMYEGDEYIAGDDRHYRITEVDDDACRATAEEITEDTLVFLDLADTAYAEKGDKRLVCMYSTHSDESYVPDDGDYSKWKNAGIYDVGNAFKDALEKKGIDVVYSEKTFLPHDTGAYSRSAATAKTLLQKSPDALFDVHRDAVPAEEYETEVDGEEMSKIRLFVGRSNANSKANMAFAKQIKAEADKEYPGLIKDIFIGRGNYNQELYPQALLLEFGTHEIDKDLVIESTSRMADVVDEVLYGGTAKAATEKSAQKNSGAAKGILWAVGIAIAAAIVYALASTGRLSAIWGRIKRSAGELTGLGKRH